MGKKTPEINSSSTADIAFLLLCYFLMTTTMDQDLGLPRRLPPMPDPNAKQENAEIHRRNIIIVRINSNNKIYAGNTGVEVHELKDKIKEFLTNPNNLDNLPEREEIVIEGFKKNDGKVMVSKGIISLQNDRATNYDTYLQVQNELVKAINELRNEWAINNLSKTYAELSDDEADIVKKAVPQIISEAEPQEIKK